LESNFKARKAHREGSCITPLANINNINNMKAIVAAIRLSISLMATMMARFAAMKPSLKQHDMSTFKWWFSGKSLGLRGLLSLWSQVQAL